MNVWVFFFNLLFEICIEYLVSLVIVYGEYLIDKIVSCIIVKISNKFCIFFSGN